MQDLLSELLWQNEEIDEAAARLCASLPGFSEAEQQYSDISRQVRDIIGSELHDQLYCQFMRYTNYEVQAYYSLGLGLRGELARALGLYSPK